jgi:signal transduction histidine kinase
VGNPAVFAGRRGAEHFHPVRAAAVTSREAGPAGADAGLRTSTVQQDPLDAARREADAAEERARWLHAMTAALLRALTPAQVATAVISEGLRAVRAEAGLLALLEPDPSTIRIAASAGCAAGTVERWRTIPIDAGAPIAEAVRTGRPAWVPDVQAQDGRFPDLAGGRSPPHVAWAVLPLVIRDRAIGALALTFGRPDIPEPAEQMFLMLLAQQCAQALERARLYEAERNARVKAEFAERRITFLYEAGARLTATLDEGAAIDGLIDLAVPELADWAVVRLVDGDGRLRTAAWRHRERDREPELRALLEHDDRAGGADECDAAERFLGHGGPELIAELPEVHPARTPRDDKHAALLGALEPRSRIRVALRAGDLPIGVLELVATAAGRRFTSTDLALAVELAARGAQAIERARLFRTTRQASQAKSDFLAVMSHELRTPLNAILGYADLVMLGVPEPIPDASRRQVERIRSAARQLLGLVEEVLGFARLVAGHEVLRIETTDLSALAHECIDRVEPAAAAKGLGLEVHVAGPVQVRTDPMKVRQILDNLLSNAIKFSERGVVRVTVRRDDGAVVLDVEDSGIGIPEDSLPHIFEPFWQVEQGSTRRFGGSGLGLGVVRELVRLLDGDVAVRSEAGRGTTFTVRLPAGFTPRPDRAEP